MNLYEIDNEILACIDRETGEIIDMERLSQLEMERDHKIENIALYIKNLNAEATACKSEKESFDKRQKAAENRAESLKRYLENFLAGSPYKSTRVSITFRKSEAVEVLDISKIPDDYLKYKEPSPDKENIKKSLKEGIAIPGAMLVEKQSVQIR